MKTLIVLSSGMLLAATVALAEPSTGQAGLMKNVPSSSLTITDWYNQNVYDRNNNKIGAVKDVLVAPDGKINALIIGVGGFLGAGEKDVAASFDAVKKTTKNDKVYLTMDTTKDALNSAPGLKYDSQKTSWVPDTSSSNASKKTNQQSSKTSR